MTVQQQLTQQFALMYSTAAANLKDVTQEQSVEQPPAGGNCANWILGHLINIHNGLMSLVGAAPVWESDQLARAGFDPITGPEHAIDWDTMREKFLGSRERCLAAIAALTDAQLDEHVPDPFGDTCPRASLLNVLAYHQAYHTGQLGTARRVAGLEGAVRAPNQPPGA
jgi:uncharacterized damage-inducible protein DinB